MPSAPGTPSSSARRSGIGTWARATRPPRATATSAATHATRYDAMAPIPGDENPAGLTQRQELRQLEPAKPTSRLTYLPFWPILIQHSMLMPAAWSRRRRPSRRGPLAMPVGALISILLVIGDGDSI